MAAGGDILGEMLFPPIPTRPLRPPLPGWPDDSHHLRWGFSQAVSFLKAPSRISSVIVMMSSQSLTFITRFGRAETY